MGCFSRSFDGAAGRERDVPAPPQSSRTVRSYRSRKRSSIISVLSFACPRFPIADMIICAHALAHGVSECKMAMSKAAVAALPDCADSVHRRRSGRQDAAGTGATPGFPRIKPGQGTVIVPGAGHGQAFSHDRDIYLQHGVWVSRSNREMILRSKAGGSGESDMVAGRVINAAFATESSDLRLACCRVRRTREEAFSVLEGNAGDIRCRGSVSCLPAFHNKDGTGLEDLLFSNRGAGENLRRWFPGPSS